jgi:hypothetical protein
MTLASARCVMRLKTRKDGDAFDDIGVAAGERLPDQSGFLKRATRESLRRLSNAGSMPM